MPLPLRCRIEYNENPIRLSEGMTVAMRHRFGICLVLICLGLLVHDTASGRFRTLRKHPDQRYIVALGHAIRQGNQAEVRRLTRMTCSVRAQPWGQVLLRVAAEEGHADAVEFFLTRGAKVNSMDSLGRTPLHRAARPAVAQSLIARGAELNVQDKQGRTPLHWAAWHGRIAVARLLIAKGAKVNVQDDGRYTALDLVEPLDGKAMGVLLRKHGAKKARELRGWNWGNGMRTAE